MKVEKIDRSFLIDDIKRLKINCQGFSYSWSSLQREEVYQFATLLEIHSSYQFLLHQIKVNL